jgi:hypothetical protein
VRIIGASMQVRDVYGQAFDKEAAVSLEAHDAPTATGPDGEEVGRAEIDLRWSDGDSRFPARASITRKVCDPELADDIGNEGDWVRTDWFEVFDATLRWYGTYLTVVGYMHGTQGILRDGRCPRTGRAHGDPFDTEGPLVRVEWTPGLRL